MNPGSQLPRSIRPPSRPLKRHSIHSLASPARDFGAGTRRDTSSAEPPGRHEREAGGTGLRLAIPKVLVDAQHGPLMLASTLGVGTQVTVSLPVVSQRQASLGDRPGRARGPRPTPHHASS